MEFIHMYVFYDRKRTHCPKRPYWGENRLKIKAKGKYIYIYIYISCCLLKASWFGTDATASGKRFQYLATLHAKLFLLLRVLTICCRSLSDDLLSPGLLENLNSLDASRWIWLYMILWVRTSSLFPIWGDRYMDVGYFLSQPIPYKWL